MRPFTLLINGDSFKDFFFLVLQKKEPIFLRPLFQWVFRIESVHKIKIVS